MQQLNAVCSRYGCRVLLGSSAGWQLALSCVDFGGVCCDGEASRCCLIHIVRSTACPPALLGDTHVHVCCVRSRFSRH